MTSRILACIVLLMAAPRVAGGQSKSEIQSRVRLELSRSTAREALFHWRITNTLSTPVYVYNVFLWGPAYSYERQGERLLVDTAPVAEQRSCPPNRFPPVLLLAVAPSRSIEGDFVDSEVRAPIGKMISMRIQVGLEPYTVGEQAKHFMSSECRQSPYDAIVQWGSVVESRSISTELLRSTNAKER